MGNTYVSDRKYIHRLLSKNAVSEEVLIVTSYDYFLQKHDLATLLRRYREIILIPHSDNDDYLLNHTVRPLLDRFEKIHLVTNPQYDRRNRVIYELVVRKNKSIRITTVYDFCERDLKKVYIPDDVTEINPNLLSVPTFGRRVRYPKKIIDITISIILFLLTFPLWILSYFRIKLESPGPVFYFQERVGMNNKPFNCIKFRSMRLDAEQNGASFSKKNDSRIFSYGSFMRLTRIDELPQIINIFRRDLSLIGPRPERPVFTETFDEIIPYYNLRHNIKPGITGYAQVMYSYGAGVYDARHKLMYDLYYIKNWNLLLELKIILLTAVVIFGKKGR
ncbi:Sugar transferase involved in LPS biosynthesis (colanic, teichoic acid) [Dyadobacter soli]|uniref:Sugar transferase involved in LPS biosynthesis (Colanic, teichoic acid) n=1 Tax=Dyadobacter soli TaxID=659014 RepID=A0A1G7RCP8_9BACT|nr:sugar transferase [Dyadobacter soli]SDG08415.1 Sugar transferase involved in LPS biosynthesis (colanic, teichoic acid) [Dyadobacter soli]